MCVLDEFGLMFGSKLWPQLRSEVVFSIKMIDFGGTTSKLGKMYVCVCIILFTIIAFKPHYCKHHNLFLVFHYY